MIELVHDRRQVFASLASVVAPSLTQAMCVEVAAQTHLLTVAGYVFI